VNTLMKMMLAAAAFTLFASETQAGDAPKASPVYKTYERRDGKKVELSHSQWAIANKQWQAIDPPAIAEMASGITVVIRVEKNDGTHMLGTGFFISPSEVATAWHLVRDAANITVVNADDRRANAQLSISRPSVDLATIIVPSAYCKTWAHFATDSDWERQGETVYVYGNPQGMDGTFSAGLLSAIRRNGAVFQISAPTDSGSSGSPVFNCYGLVIAIVGDQLVSSAQLSFALTSNSIYEALGLKSDDHPDGFDLGLTQGLELRDQSEIDADIAMANAARIEAEAKAKAAAGPTEAEKLQAQHDEQVRADNARTLQKLTTPSLPQQP
jgi:S1-C subfamily serine protease